MSDATPQTRKTAPSPTRSVSVETPGLLRSSRLVLRPLTESDRGPFIEMLRKNAEMLEGRLPLHETGEGDDAFFERQLDACRKGDADRTCCRRVAELTRGCGVLKPGAIIGCFNLNSIQRGLSWEADAAWWVDRTVTGHGLATEGVSTLLAYAFDTLPGGLGLHGVHCGIEATNTASVRVAEKSGFEHRPGAQSYLKVGPRWVNHEFYIATPEAVAALSA